MNKAAYIALLSRHDWTYQWSDDPAIWRRGTEQRRQLLEMQKSVDPAGELWNKFAPADMQMVDNHAAQEQN